MYIFDIDGTIANIDHRLHYIKDKPKNWDAFYEACSNDSVIEPIARIVRLMQGNAYSIAFLTGRRESARTNTVAWLKKYYLYSGTDLLLMRKDNDYRPDYVIKPELLKELPYTVTAIFEDRSSVVREWRRLGYVCLHVAAGDF